MKSRAVKIKLAAMSVMIATVLFVATFLGGCTLFDMSGYYAEFTQSRINLSVGDKYDLSKVIYNNGVNIKISSSDPEVADVSGTTLSANKTGSATIMMTYSSGSSTLRVVVEEEGLEIVAYGDIIQQIDRISSYDKFDDITFKVNTSGSVTDGKIYWFVDDTRNAIKYADDSFVYKPTGIGEVVITAKSAANIECSDSVTVRTYYTIAASGKAVGEFVQDGDEYSPITLSVNADNIIYNPDNFIEWKVDGNNVYAGTETTYSYMPTPGEHKIELYVNGEKRTINGMNAITLTCSGSIVPNNVEVVFDNMYPHLYIRADVEGDMQVEISEPNGNVRAYNKSTHAKLFDENGFDAASIIQLCAIGSQQTYGIRVKSLGDGDLLYESDYSASVEFTQLPSAAKPYIQNIYLDRDHYITSDEEYVNLFEYYVIGRKKTVSSPTVTFECYVGYEMTYTAEQLWNYAFRIGATSGNYTGKGAWLTNNGKILNTSMKVSTVNTPTRQTYSTSSTYDYNAQMHSNIPHINYDEDKYRPDDYVFPIDRCEHTASVRYTDELYLASQNNTRPVPVSGSAADTVYSMARNILRQIISDDMTDKQKAHAIYDWIMWQVTYDKPATYVSRDGESLSAYYLEGVFGDGKTPINGVVYYPYAVCDGMSKAYSLMCNIEGIPCVRVSGMAGNSVSGAGGHAWNKVFIDGAWYVVDCTWGDAVSTRKVGGMSADYEFGLHDWLFVTDEMADSTHYEPYTFSSYNASWGECEIVYAPRTAAKPLSPYTDMVYNGYTINCEVAAGENQRDRVTDIMKTYARYGYKKIDSLYVPGRGDGIYAIDYQSVEIHFENARTISSTQLSTLVKAAVLSVMPRAKVEVFSYSDNTVFVLVKA